jgi:hypothetical protein
VGGDVEGGEHLVMQQSRDATIIVGSGDVDVCRWLPRMPLLHEQRSSSLNIVVELPSSCLLSSEDDVPLMEHLR